MPPRARPRATPRLTVRMYVVGFGDCFLVTARPGRRVWRMLVDCGVHNQGIGDHSMDEVVGDVVAACTDADGRARLDVVVATHRHQDHIRGFADERWADVEVGEVWLPWTEDPADREANALRAQQDGLARSLALALQADGDDEHAALAWNSLTNEDCMWTLRQGFAGDVARRYVVGDPATPHPVPGLPGGVVHFLGPSRDVATLRKMEAPVRERWLAPQASQGDRASAGSGPPAFPSFVVDEQQFCTSVPDAEVDDDLRTRLASTAGADAVAAAASLDRAVNNTSLVLLLRVGGASLLLPGDAQWGAWQPLLESAEVRALLAQVTHYKVSHHGSHNGTPRSLVRDVLSDTVTSLVSVRAVKQWAEIPKDTLMEALHTQQRCLLSSDGTFDLLPGARVGGDGLWYEVDVSPGT